MMLEIARLLEQDQTQPSGTNRYVTEALAIMRRDYAEPLTAAVIAHQLHIQPTYLHRLFREHTNKTMNEHLQSIRHPTGEAAPDRHRQEPAGNRHGCGNFQPAAFFPAVPQMDGALAAGIPEKRILPAPPPNKTSPSHPC